MKNIYRSLFSFLILFVLIAGNVALVSAAPQPGIGTAGSQTAVNAVSGQGIGELTTKATSIANVILGIIALIAVFIILWAGFLFMTSGGEEEATDAAKNYLKYGIIGLIVAALAFSVVKVVNDLLAS